MPAPTRPNDYEARLTRLETALPYIEEDLREARADVMAIKRSAITTLWSILFVTLLATFGAIFRKLGVF
jgi:hypothetical protein